MKKVIHKNYLVIIFLLIKEASPPGRLDSHLCRSL